MNGVTGPMPPFDPLGLSVPAPILLGLTYLTFTLHLVAVQTTLGSVALALWDRSRNGPSSPVARFLGTLAPLGFSYLVTFGIPPLLFTQVLYGQFFYSSSVLLAAFWILVIPLLILAYASLYAHRLTRDRRPRFQGLLLFTALLGILTIGWIYSNNLTLAMTPSRWLEHYLAHPDGVALNLQEPTLWWRWITVLGPAPLAAAVALAIWASGRSSQVEAPSLQGLGTGAVGIGAGLWALGLLGVITSLPDTVLQAVRSHGPWTALAGIGVSLLTAAAVLAWTSLRSGRRSLAILAAISHTLAMACLVVLRDRIRWAYLEGVFSLDRIPLYPDWGPFLIFVGVLLAGVVFLLALLFRQAAPNPRP